MSPRFVLTILLLLLAVTTVVTADNDATDVPSEDEVTVIVETKKMFYVKVAFTLLLIVISTLVILKKLMECKLGGKYLKAELWDNVHFDFLRYCNGICRSSYTYDFRLDKDIALQAFDTIYKDVPILHSSYHGGFFAFWRVLPFKIEDAVLIKEVPESEAEAVEYEFLCSDIYPHDPLQMKALVLYHGDKTTVCTLVPHMVMDGGSHKYILTGFCDNYNKLAGKEAVTHLKMGNRAYSAIYSDMTTSQKWGAFRLLRNINIPDNTTYFPYTKNAEGDRAMVVRRKVEPEFLERIKSAGRKCGASVNDVIIAIFLQALYEVAGFNESQFTYVSCAVDLRRYLVGESKESVTNHTSWIQCFVPQKGGTILETLEYVKTSIASFKRDPFMGLHCFPVVGVINEYLPRAVSNFLFNLVYKHPPCAISNVGRIDTKAMSLAGREPIDGFQTGYIGYKPYFVMTTTTLGSELSLTTCLRGNDKDLEIVHHFFDLMIEHGNALYEQSKSM